MSIVACKRVRGIYVGSQWSEIKRRSEEMGREEDEEGKRRKKSERDAQTDLVPLSQR